MGRAHREHQRGLRQNYLRGHVRQKHRAPCEHNCDGDDENAQDRHDDFPGIRLRAPWGERAAGAALQDARRAGRRLKNSAAIGASGLRGAHGTRRW